MRFRFSKRYEVEDDGKPLYAVDVFIDEKKATTLYKDARLRNDVSRWTTSGIYHDALVGIGDIELTTDLFFAQDMVARFAHGLDPNDGSLGGWRELNERDLPPKEPVGTLLTGEQARSIRDYQLKADPEVTKEHLQGAILSATERELKQGAAQFLIDALECLREDGVWDSKPGRERERVTVENTIADDPQFWAHEVTPMIQHELKRIEKKRQSRPSKGMER